MRRTGSRSISAQNSYACFQRPLHWSLLSSICSVLIRTRRGNKFLLVITDRFSKLVRTIPLRRITAMEIAKAFTHQWVFFYGPPLTLLSDNGPQFAAKLFIDICRIIGTKNRFTTTYHPQCNGQVERFNRTIINALRHCIADRPKEWDLFTDALTFAYNTQVHSTTGLSPFELVLPRRPPTLSLQAEPDVSSAVSAKEYHVKWKTWLAAFLNTAKTFLAKRQARYKCDMDKSTRPPAEVMKVGAQVFLRKEYTNPKVEKKHKLSPITEGPFPVREVGLDTLVLERGDGSHERVSRDRVVLAPVVVDKPSPTMVPVTSTTPPHGVSTPLQQANPNRGLGELPPLFGALETRQQGVRHRIPPTPPTVVRRSTPSHDRTGVRNNIAQYPIIAESATPAHQSGSGDVSRQGNTGEDDDGANIGKRQASDAQSPAAHRGGSRKSSRFIARSEHSIGVKDRTSVETDEFEQTADVRDSEPLSKGTPFWAGRAGSPAMPTGRTGGAETPSIGETTNEDRVPAPPFKGIKLQQKKPSPSNNTVPPIVGDEDPPSGRGAGLNTHIRGDRVCQPPQEDDSLSPKATPTSETTTDRSTGTPLRGEGRTANPIKKRGVLRRGGESWKSQGDHRSPSRNTPSTPQGGDNLPQDITPLTETTKVTDHT